MTPITVLRSAGTIFLSEPLGRRRNVGHEFGVFILDTGLAVNMNDVGPPPEGAERTWPLSLRYCARPSELVIIRVRGYSLII